MSKTVPKMNFCYVDGGRKATNYKKQKEIKKENKYKNYGGK